MQPHTHVLISRLAHPFPRHSYSHAFSVPPSLQQPGEHLLAAAPCSQTSCRRGNQTWKTSSICLLQRRCRRVSNHSTQHTDAARHCACFSLPLTIHVPCLNASPRAPRYALPRRRSFVECLSSFASAVSNMQQPSLESLYMSQEGLAALQVSRRDLQPFVVLSVTSCFLVDAA